MFSALSISVLMPALLLLSPAQTRNSSAQWCSLHLTHMSVVVNGNSNRHGARQFFFVHSMFSAQHCAHFVVSPVFSMHFVVGFHMAHVLAFPVSVVVSSS